MQNLETTCCISGGGPAGIMLGFLLARAGVDVTVLEKWPDFFRDFRGDTIHPSTMQVLRELGLLEKFLALPHNETKELHVRIGDEEAIIADFTHLKHAPAFLAFIPQWDFLNFIAAEGKNYPNFHLLMNTECTDLLWQERREERKEKSREGKQVIGVKAKNAEGEFQIHAQLVVGADGRHSTVREKAGLRIEDLGAPIDVLWFSLLRKNSDEAVSFGFVNEGKMLILIDRDSYWQCGFIIRKDSFESVKAEGLEKFKETIQKLKPSLSESVHELTSWDQVKFLSVTVDHLSTWYLPGLICIGDSAHAMSPVGGVGINLAIQDAVAAANILIPAFAHKRADNEKSSGVQLSDLQAIQTRRSGPARMTQNLQVFIHRHVLERVLSSTGKATFPWQLRVIKVFPYLRRIPAYIVGMGFRPEHIKR